MLPSWHSLISHHAWSKGEARLYTHINRISLHAPSHSRWIHTLQNLVPAVQQLIVLLTTVGWRMRVFVVCSSIHLQARVPCRQLRAASDLVKRQRLLFLIVTFDAAACR